MSQNVEPPKASVHEVVMKKEELLNALLENKAKHDEVYAAAVAGYWDTAKEVLEKKRKELTEAVGNYTQDVQTQISRLETKVVEKEVLPNYLSVKALQFVVRLDLNYPEDHTKDYERAIRMMQASIYDNVKLSAEDFSRYVLNDWEWRESFVTSNAGYVSRSQTGMFYAVSGNPSGFMLASGYDAGRSRANNLIKAQGIKGVF